ncbi:MAG: hypothetical protein GWN71_00770, partial [Gammaproteobacteria bacterium]|nr:hypothetical protein [Gemmatimonadota bacterium]NIU72153.1 hypothetical protein [Gammaproteobacteria bacterium]
LQHHPLAALIAIVALLLAGAFPAIWEGNARKWATWSWGVLYGVVQLAGPVAVALSISWG